MDINRICATCGTNKNDPNTAKCINQHENWLTLADLDYPHKYYSVKYACTLLKITKDQLEEALEQGKDISKPNASAVASSLSQLTNPENIIGFIDGDGRHVKPSDNQALQVVYNQGGNISRIEVWQQMSDTTILRVKTWAKAKINFIFKQGQEQNAIAL